MPDLAFNQIKDQKESVLAIVKANLNGKNLTLRGLAKLCEVSKTSIIESGHVRASKLATMLTEHGFEAWSLVEEGFNAQATWLVIVWGFTI